VRRILRQKEKHKTPGQTGESLIFFYRFQPPWLYILSGWLQSMEISARVNWLKKGKEIGEFGFFFWSHPLRKNVRSLIIYPSLGIEPWLCI
jgi:hypothetical protein